MEFPYKSKGNDWGKLVLCIVIIGFIGICLLSVYVSSSGFHKASIVCSKGYNQNLTFQGVYTNDTYVGNCIGPAFSKEVIITFGTPDQNPSFQESISVVSPVTNQTGNNTQLIDTISQWILPITILFVMFAFMIPFMRTIFRDI